VVDTGMGIPKAEQPRLFEKFFRSSLSQDQATPGTGLGLTIVKAIVTEHGGTVAVESEEGVGTAVAFTLPRAH
jgi:signal transduction histidine kinase